MQLLSDDLARAHRSMRTIRPFEEAVRADAQAGRVPGSTHLPAGQEAPAVGVCKVLEEDDWNASTHRGHGQPIAEGCAPGPMMAGILGRATGTCHGAGARCTSPIWAAECWAPTASWAAGPRSPAARRSAHGPWAPEP